MVAVTCTEIACARCGTEVLAVRPKSAGSTRASAGQMTPEERVGARQETGFKTGSGTPVFRFDSPHPVTGHARPEKKESNPGRKSKPAVVQTLDRPQKETGNQAKHRIEQPHDFGNRQAQEMASGDEPRATGSMLTFFAGQFLIAWAWYWSSFPPFAAGVIITLTGTFGILRAFQIATSSNRQQPTAIPSSRGLKARRGNRRTISQRRSAE